MFRLQPSTFEKIEKYRRDQKKNAGVKKEEEEVSKCLIDDSHLTTSVTTDNGRKNGEHAISPTLRDAKRVYCYWRNLYWRTRAKKALEERTRALVAYTKIKKAEDSERQKEWARKFASKYLAEEGKQEKRLVIRHSPENPTQSPGIGSTSKIDFTTPEGREEADRRYRQMMRARAMMADMEKKKRIAQNMGTKAPLVYASNDIDFTTREGRAEATRRYRQMMDSRQKQIKRQAERTREQKKRQAEKMYTITSWPSAGVYRKLHKKEVKEEAVVQGIILKEEEEEALRQQSHDDHEYPEVKEEVHGAEEVKEEVHDAEGNIHEYPEVKEEVHDAEGNIHEYPEVKEEVHDAEDFELAVGPSGRLEASSAISIVKQEPLEDVKPTLLL